tara:strand:- start:35 stop:220 length:186 start_codon:yes stop_codon:yes gene_type:complete
MYVYKFTITYKNGHIRNEWLCCEAGETVASLKDRADNYVDEIEQDEFVASVKMTRRTVPGI